MSEGAGDWAALRLEKSPQSAGPEPSIYTTEADWQIATGINAYNRKDYDRALEHFAKVGPVSGPAYVRWKFYEAMSIFRKEQFKKAVLLERTDVDAVDSVHQKLRAIVERHEDDVLYDDAKYWLAQCLRYLMGDEQTAFGMFKEPLEKNADNPEYPWREGTTYYYAFMLLDKGNPVSRREAVVLARSSSGISDAGLV